MQTEVLLSKTCWQWDAVSVFSCPYCKVRCGKGRVIAILAHLLGHKLGPFDWPPQCTETV